MSVEISIEGAKEFFDAMEAAARGGFRKEMELFLEGLGNEFLQLVEDEIIRRHVIDTRLLLASFHKGSDNNIWELTDGGLTLEVGSSLEYAGWVNDGHKQQPGRFIPGYWSGDRFVYDSSADGGMVLKQRWVDGKHYWESAIRILEKMMPEMLDAKMQEWIDKYF